MDLEMEKPESKTMTLTPIRTLKAHPENARLGNIDLIAQSLEHHGQYSPIVISQDNVILAGHHVTQAAKKLGWKDIETVQVVVNAEQARKILLTDNRTSDLAAYNETILLELIEALPDLNGTGFGAADIDALDAIIHGDTPETPPKGEETPPTDTVELKLGHAFHTQIPRDHWQAWKDTHLTEMKRGKALNTIKTMLQLPTPPKPEHTPPNIAGHTETVPINDITPHPTNPREGDIGAVAQSLENNGQYKPITVNRTTGHIIKGNHTYMAARSLGWNKISVHWIDVTLEEETKILLIDNRTADLATYNTDALKNLLTEIRDLTGTGYTQSDANDILNGGTTRPGPKPTGQTQMKLADYGWRTPTDLYEQWAAALTLQDVIELLQLHTTPVGIQS